MLQKILLRTIGAMLGSGFLGMLAVYFACTRGHGPSFCLSALAAPAPIGQETAVSVPVETERLRNKILAGGCAGLLVGLAASAGLSRRSP